MTPKQRLLQAINHEQPDRVPISPRHNIRDFLKVALGLSESFGDYLEFAISVDIDPNFILNMPFPLPANIEVREHREDYGDSLLVTTEFHTPQGVLTKRIRDFKDQALRELSSHPGNQTKVAEFLIKDEDDLDKLSCLLHYSTDQPIDFSPLHNLQRMVGDNGLVMCTVPLSFESAALKRGAEQLMMDLCLNPAFAGRLLAICHEDALNQTERFLQAGAEMILLDGCWTSTSLLSPRHFDQFVAPFVEEQTALTHKYGAQLHYFIDGKCFGNLETLRAIKVDVVSPMDPPPQGDVDLAVVKERFGKDICIWGGINAPLLLGKESPEHIREAVRGAIHLAGRGGGFVLSTADSIQPNTPLENYMAFLDAAKAYGRCPLNPAVFRDHWQWRADVRTSRGRGRG